MFVILSLWGSNNVTNDKSNALSVINPELQSPLTSENDVTINRPAGFGDSSLIAVVVMSNREEREADALYEAENDRSPVPRTPLADNSYVRETRREIADINPIVPDNAEFKDPVQPPYSNTKGQLAQDESEAIDKLNILPGDRLRHAQPQTANRYNEGLDENKLPREVRDGILGRSAVRRLS
ncbi:hypothetical protein V8E54_012882 [Elaphomyces granulatus]